VEPHPAGQLDDRGAVTDGRHDALVAVAERDGGLPAGQPADLAGGMLAHLQGRLGELRQRLVLDDCHVADREDVAMPGDPEVGAGADTAAGGLRQAPAGDGGRGRHPRRPHGDITGQGGAVGQQDPVGRDLGDGGVEMDVDAALDQLLAGIFTQRRVERCQQFRRLLDQGDVHPRPVDLRIGRGERDVAQVGETAGQFDAGRAAADDGHPDIPAQAGEADPFQARHEPVTQDDGVLPGVQAQGVLGRAGNAVIRGGHAGGQDEVVVAQPCPIGQHDLPGRGLDGGKFAVPEHRAVPSADGADRVSHVAAGYAGAGHLVQQRLEGAVDVAVDQRGPHPGPGKLAHRGQAAEPGADHQHPCRPVPGRLLLRPCGRRHLISTAAVISRPWGDVPAACPGYRDDHEYDRNRHAGETPWLTKRLCSTRSPR
jgi:hypothetical protein